MALYPAPDMRTGAISVWVAGAEEAERAAEVVRGLGHVGRRVAASRGDRALRSLRAACAAPSRPPPDKSISHRAAIIGAMGEGETRISGYLDAADTRSTLAAVRRPRRRGSIERGPPARVAAWRSRSPGRGLRGASPAAGAIDVGNAGTLLRLLPGWLAGQPAGEWTLDGDESIRRRPVDRVAEPLRRMGADGRGRDERLPPLQRPRLGAARHRVPPPGRERPGEVVRAARRPAGRGRDHGDRAGAEPRPHRAHAARGRRRGRRSSRRRDPGDDPRRSCRRSGSPSRPAARLDARRAPGPGRLLLGRLLPRRRRDRPRQRGAARGTSASTRRGSASSGSSTGWGRRSR